MHFVACWADDLIELYLIQNLLHRKLLNINTTEKDVQEFFPNAFFGSILIYFFIVGSRKGNFMCERVEIFPIFMMTFLSFSHPFFLFSAAQFYSMFSNEMNGKLCHCN